MIDLGGAVTCQDMGDKNKLRVRITNGTTLELRACRLSGRGEGWIEQLGPGQSADVDLRSGANAQSAGTNVPRGPGTLDELRQNFTLRDDGLRMVAETSTPVPGLTLEPAPSLQRQTTLVVVQLQYVDPPPARDTAGRDYAKTRVRPPP
jgi:hypothetical protein